jgi:dTMP kinase
MSKFIVFEGIDGSGKSTLSKNIFHILQNRNIDLDLFREPTSFETGIELRKFLQNKIQLSPEEQMKLFIADRKESVNRNILPGLQNKKFVLLDRYYFSTAAYQASSLNSPMEILQRNLVENFPKPNLIFFLDIDPELATKRIHTNRDEIDVFENLEKLITIRENYLSILPKDTIFLDASLSPEELTDIAIKKIESGK